MNHSLTGLDALAYAVRANDAAAVARVLRDAPELASQLDQPMPGESFGATPLLAAVHRNNRAVVEVLLQAGADINARSHWWAGSFGVLDHDGPLTEFLISRGATVDIHAAAKHGLLDRLRALLSADPSLVHARGGDGQTPLHFASSIEVADHLLDHGADRDARDVDHESTPAQWMVRDRTTVARHLVERGAQADILLVSALGDEARVRACLEADPSAIRTTVSERSFPKKDPRSGGHIYNWTLGTGKSPHVVAHEFGHASVLRLLLERSPDELRLSVLCETGNEAEVKALLAGRPFVAAALTEADLRKLPDAARDQNARGVRLMLEAGWPVDARGQHAGTALHWAAWNGDAALTKTILTYGPSLELVDADHGGTPLGWAIYGSVHGWRCRTGDYAGTVEALLDAGARTPEASRTVAASDAVRAVLTRRP